MSFWINRYEGCAECCFPPIFALVVSETSDLVSQFVCPVSFCHFHTLLFLSHVFLPSLTRALFLLSHIRLALTGLDTIASVSENICDVKLRNGDLELISP